MTICQAICLPLIGKQIASLPTDMRPINEIRRENLLALVREAGSQVEVANRIRKDKNQVHQWLLVSGDAARNIGPRSARLLEAAFNKPEGWLDKVHSHEWGNGEIGGHTPSGGGQIASPDRPNVSQVTDGVQKNNPAGSRNLRTEDVIVREGIVMVANYFKAHRSNVRVEEDVDLLVKGYLAQKGNLALWDEIYSEIKARAKRREATKDGQEQGGVKGAGKSDGKR